MKDIGGKKEMRYKAKFLHLKGWKPDAIAEELKISVSTVYRFIKK